MDSDFYRRLSEWATPGDSSRRAWLVQRLHLDLPLLLIGLVLFAGGATVLYSVDAGGGYLRQQFVFLGLGLVSMLVVAQLPPDLLRRWAPLAYFGSLGLLVVVLLVGVSAKGAQRWLDLVYLRFQPAEVVKLALPLMLAAYLGDRAMPVRFHHLLAALALLALPVGLILLQPDLGTAILVACIGLAVLFLAGLGWRYILAAALTLPILAGFAWLRLLHDYQKQRVLTLLNPQEDKLGAGWNIIQSNIAIGSGGWTGKGWLAGTQARLDFLPESHTDFIIAVLAEEFGLRGVLLLLAGYSLLFARGMWISYHAKNSFSRLLAAALTFALFAYVFVNMGMASGILPVVGVPLPLVSYGGTSLIATFITFGMLMAIARERENLYAK